jgi:large subunit ribosomal protein L30
MLVTEWREVASLSPVPIGPTLGEIMKIKVVQRKSGIGRPKNQRETLRGLGLTKMNKARILEDTPAIRGMIKKIEHLVEWEVVNG